MEDEKIPDKIKVILNMSIDRNNNTATPNELIITDENDQPLQNITNTVKNIVIPHNGGNNSDDTVTDSNNGNNNNSTENKFPDPVEQDANQEEKEEAYNKLITYLNYTDKIPKNKKTEVIKTIENFINNQNTKTLNDLTSNDKFNAFYNNLSDDEKTKLKKIIKMYNNHINSHNISILIGGKRRRKTSKRSSGGKRKTSKYQKRKSGKYRQ